MPSPERAQKGDTWSPAAVSDSIVLSGECDPLCVVPHQEQQQLGWEVPRCPTVLLTNIPSRGARSAGPRPGAVSVRRLSVGLRGSGEWGMDCRGTATVASPQGGAGPRAPPWDTAGRGACTDHLQGREDSGWGWPAGSKAETTAGGGPRRGHSPLADATGPQITRLPPPLCPQTFLGDGDQLPDRPPPPPELGSSDPPCLVDVLSWHRPVSARVLTRHS